LSDNNDNQNTQRMLLSGDEAVAHAAINANVALGTGYPGTPSTEIIETFNQLGGRAEWSPNEKVAFEVALGAAFAGARALVTMKHVGLNVAADPLFTAAYTGVGGGMVVVSADDPGMASSQNEQDNRYYARAAGVPMLEPADSQEAYDFTLRAFELSEQFGTLVLLRMTTRSCHSKTVVTVRTGEPQRSARLHYERDVASRVMIPANARPAHRRLRQRMDEITAFAETCDLNVVYTGDGRTPTLGIVTSGVSYMHALEAAPHAGFLKLGLTWPLAIEKIRAFATSVDRCVVIEEGEDLLAGDLRAAGLNVESKETIFSFGELTVDRARRILRGDRSPEPTPQKSKPPQLCKGCPHRAAFEILRRLGCIVAGDIGCYTLGVLPPFEAMDTCVCMGASIGVGLGMRHVLPDDEAKKVVSVIGDSTFVHSGLTGLVEMVYNPPPTGHVVLVLDNGTTAMTGFQEHPGTGRRMDHTRVRRLSFEDIARSAGVERVEVVDPQADKADFERALAEALSSGKLCMIVARRPCLLAAARVRKQQIKEGRHAE